MYSTEKWGPSLFCCFLLLQLSTVTFLWVRQTRAMPWKSYHRTSKRHIIKQQFQHLNANINVLPVHHLVEIHLCAAVSHHQAQQAVCSQSPPSSTSSPFACNNETGWEISDWSAIPIVSLFCGQAMFEVYGMKNERFITRVLFAAGNSTRQVNTANKTTGTQLEATGFWKLCNSTVPCLI